jgi:hypothetical protein
MTQNTPCPECNKLEEGGRCPEHLNIPTVKARICPIEDGTCPTTAQKIKRGEPGHCGYDAHIIRAKKTQDAV